MNNPSENYRNTLLPSQQYASVPTEYAFMAVDQDRIRNEMNNRMNASNPNSSDTAMNDGSEPEAVDSLFNSFNQRIKHLEQLYLQNQ